ncbi:MAG: hypothetical protein R3D58_00570 [Saprospiraceae bacterium]
MIKSLHHHLAPPPAVGAAQPAVTASLSFQAESKGIIKMLGLLHAGVNDMVLAVYRSSECSNRATMHQVKWAVDVFTSDMEKVKGNALQAIALPNMEAPDAEFAINFGGKPWLILLRFQKKPHRMVLYRCPIDLEGMIGSPEEFGSYPVEKVEYPVSEHGLLVAPDASKLLFVYYPSSDSFNDPVSFALFDSNWSQLQSGYFNLPQMGYELRVGQAFFAPDNTIWMPSWTALEQNNGVLQDLWIWQDPAMRPKRIDVRLDPDKLITSMKISLGTDGKLYVGGVWAQATKKNLRAVPVEAAQYAQGCFFLKIDPDNQVILSKTTATFSDTLFRFWSLGETEVNENGLGIKHLCVGETKPVSDGSFWVTMEVNLINPAFAANPSGGAAYPKPFSGPVIIVKYGPDGTLQSEILVKRQIMSVEGSGNGHLLLPYADSGLLLYNVHQDDISDEPQHFGQLRLCQVVDIEGLAMWQQDSTAAALDLSSTPNGTATILFNFKEKEYWFDPSAWLQVSPTRLIVGCDGRNGNYGLIRVDWPE